MNTIRFQKRSQEYQDIIEYLEDTSGFAARWSPATSDFRLEDVPLDKLDGSRIRSAWRMGRRLLRADEHADFGRTIVRNGFRIYRDMIYRTESAGKPIILDNDYAVIDGMHRLTDAVYRGDKTIKAYRRIPTARK